MNHCSYHFQQKVNKEKPEFNQIETKHLCSKCKYINEFGQLEEQEECHYFENCSMCPKINRKDCLSF